MTGCRKPATPERVFGPSFGSGLKGGFGRPYRPSLITVYGGGSL
jgi:hypothetical protein